MALWSCAILKLCLIDTAFLKAQAQETTPATNIAGNSGSATIAQDKAQLDNIEGTAAKLVKETIGLKEEMDRRQETTVWNGFGDPYMMWGGYDPFMMMPMGPGLGESVVPGPPLPPRKEIVNKIMGDLKDSTTSLKQQVDGFILPTSHTSAIAAQLRVLEDIVPRCAEQYEQLSTATAGDPQDYDRDTIDKQLHMLHDNASGIKEISARMKKMLGHK